MSKNNKELPAWDLSDLYKNIKDPKIQKDLDQYKKINLDLSKKYRGKLASIAPQEFAEAIALYEKAVIISHTVMGYAFLNMCTQMSNKEAMAFYQNSNEKIVEYSKPSIFFTLEINRISDAKLKTLLKEPKVAYYKPWLETLRQYKKYELSEEMEELLADKSVTSSSAWERLYEETASSLKYFVDGQEYNDAEISKLIMDADPVIREKAGKEISRVMKENASLFTLIINMLIKDKAIEDDKRGFASPYAARNLENRADDEVVDALANAVKNRYADISHRFYKLKAKWLGVKKLQYWDRNAPLPFASEDNVSWEDAVKLVTSAYHSFSKEWGAMGEKFFKNPWIDVPPRKGKRSGAFCMGISSKTHPYLLLNYVNKERDVLTLAHELGHGCHDLLATKQGQLNDSTPKILAEVASVFGEAITFKKMLEQTTDDKARLILLAGKASDMINTAARQIAFHMFEKRIHDERKSGELLPERINQIWVEEMQSYLGKYVVVDDYTACIWPQVHHFFGQAFYVYSYSFADCLVNSLYQVYREGSVKDFEKKYLTLLSETGIKKYDELLKPFGLDAHDSKFWDKGMDLLSEYIDELEALTKKLKL